MPSRACGSLGRTAARIIACFARRAIRSPSSGRRLTPPNTSTPLPITARAYQYLVQAVAGPTQQSEVSAPATITPKDIFPPAVPSGVSAVAGVNAIELAWERNTEPDFKGYNVYRSVDGGPFEKIASEITAPAYSDHQVESGNTYRYQVSAVDVNGLESQRSAPQQVTAQ